MDEKTRRVVHGVKAHQITRSDRMSLLADDLDLSLPEIYLSSLGGGFAEDQADWLLGEAHYTMDGGPAGAEVSLYTILFHFKALMWESIIL